MPVIAIGVAIAADVGASAAIGSLIAGTVTLTGALEVVGAVGATVSAIGAVTHDKTLSTVGMVLGGIGGIGALASSAGLFGADAAAGTPLFGDASSSISDIEPVTVTPQAASIGMDSGLGTAGAAPVNAVQEGQLPDIINTLGGVNPTTPGPASAIDQSIGAASGNASDIPPVTVTQQAASIGGDDGNLAATGAASTTGLNQASNATPISSATISGGTAAAPAQAPPPPGTSPPAVNGTPIPDVKIPGQTYVGQDGTTYVTDGTKFVPQKSLFSSLFSSPLAQYGVIQAAGSFLSGATSTLTPAQVAQLDSQAAANNAAAKLTQTQTTNISQPIPTASRTQPVTGQTGLINSPVPANNVTGSVSA